MVLVANGTERGNEPIIVKGEEGPEAIDSGPLSGTTKREVTAGYKSDMRGKKAFWACVG